ncbi:MAG: hypothetical protein P4M07_17235 [Xanthobacteraceae bacterium]|nr:hypothetical protein [Xanthobacteraceae bacterium]
MRPLTLGDVGRGQEPQRSDLRRERVTAFDLTNLGGAAHSRAFNEIAAVMGLIEQWRAEGREMAGSKPDVADQ